MCLIISLFLLLATFVEVELLSIIASELGASNMWLLLIGTGFIGWRLIGEQKFQQQKMQERMLRGELTDPGQMMRPLISLLSGILLIIPGPLTDLIGLAMLHPMIGQRVLQSLFKGGLQAMMKNAQGGFGGAGGPFGGAGGPFGGAGGPFGGAGGPFGGAGGPFGGAGGPFGGAGGGPFGDSGFTQDADAGAQSSIHRESAPSASREGVHPTQKPRKPAKKGKGAPRTGREQVNPQQVIIDVDAEIIDK